MTFTMNGIDFSAYIQRKIDITETPRRITGPHSGTALDGSYIEDYITTKYDVSVRTKPLPDAMISALLAEFEGAYVTLVYTSFLTLGDVRRIQAVPTASTLRFLTEYAEGRIYGDLVLSFTER